MKTPTPASAALTEQIVALRAAGLDWRAIGAHVGLSQTAARERYLRWVGALPSRAAQNERREKQNAS